MWMSHSSVQLSRSVVYDSLQLHGLQHTNLSCPSPTPRAYSNSCPLKQWCHPTILSSVVPLSSCPQSFPASGSFQMSQLFAAGGQSTVVSASASALPMNIQDYFPLGWTGWISLQSKGLSRVFSNTTVQKHLFFGAQLSLSSNSHIHTWLLENFDYMNFVGKEMYLLFNMLSRLHIAFLPKSKHLLISWLQSPSSVIFFAKSLQLCPTLCDPIEGSPPGSPIPRILQARTLEWVAISSSNAWKWKVKVKSLSCVRLLATPWTAAYQASLSMGFSRQENWSGVPLPSPSVILEHPKIKSLTVSIVSPSICHKVIGPDAMILVFWMLCFKPTVSLSSFMFIKRLFSSLLSAISVVSSVYLRLLIFLLAILIPSYASSSLEFHTIIYF